MFGVFEIALLIYVDIQGFHIHKAITKDLLASEGRDTHNDFVLATGNQRLAIKFIVSRP